VRRVEPAGREKFRHPFGELAGAKGLDEVGVGPDSLAFTDVFLHRLHREQDHGNVSRPTAGLYGMTEFVPVDLRHDHIGNDEVGSRLACEKKPLFTVGGGEAFKSFRRDHFLQRVADVRFVIDDEDLHGGAGPAAALGALNALED
jgi:hypothetical protein